MSWAPDRRHRIERGFYRGNIARRAALRIQLDDWCRRTGTPIGTASQHLFGNGRALDGSGDPLPDDAEDRVRAMIAAHPLGIDPRETAEATAVAAARRREEARLDAMRGQRFVMGAFS